MSGLFSPGPWKGDQEQLQPFPEILPRKNWHCLLAIPLASASDSSPWSGAIEASFHGVGIMDDVFLLGIPTL